jgi:Rad3-related DNA helicase
MGWEINKNIKNEKKKKTLIIFDEAHNVPDKACEGSSYQISLGFLE